MHILFVDDNKETCDLFRLYFKMGGHEARIAQDGLEALHILEQGTHVPDVIIMDYHMPQMNGLEVVQELRHKHNLASVPIILFTGDTRGNMESQARELGVDRVLYKPIVPAHLLVAAQEVARQH